MQKWEKKIVVLGVVITLVLLVRRATKEDIEFRQLKVKNITKRLPTSRKRRYAPRLLEQIDQIVIHHSATTSGSPESYARHHVENNGWPGIGYHFVIQKDGEVFQTNELDTISYHVSGQNTNSIGICLTGHYDKQQPPTIQLQKCAQLVVALRQKFLRHLDIKGHRDFSTKTCPGNNLDLNDLKSLVDAYEQPIQT
ncbi:MAG: peptidoglycan recognition family protein [Bacteroidota bacterium]